MLAKQHVHIERDGKNIQEGENKIKSLSWQVKKALEYSTSPDDKLIKYIKIAHHIV